jgi:hypothetical protein
MIAGRRDYVVWRREAARDYASECAAENRVLRKPELPLTNQQSSDRSSMTLK